MIILAAWIVLGIIFFMNIKENFLYGRWRGMSVEEILKTKMQNQQAN